MCPTWHLRLRCDAYEDVHRGAEIIKQDTHNEYTSPEGSWLHFPVKRRKRRRRRAQNEGWAQSGGGTYRDV